MHLQECFKLPCPLCKKPSLPQAGPIRQDSHYLHLRAQCWSYIKCTVAGRAYQMGLLSPPLLGTALVLRQAYSCRQGPSDGIPITSTPGHSAGPVSGAQPHAGPVRHGSRHLHPGAQRWSYVRRTAWKLFFHHTPFKTSCWHVTNADKLNHAPFHLFSLHNSFLPHGNIP